MAIRNQPRSDPGMYALAGVLLMGQRLCMTPRGSLVRLSAWPRQAGWQETAKRSDLTSGFSPFFIAFTDRVACVAHDF
jgi:hypothetical protein